MAVKTAEGTIPDEDGDLCCLCCIRCSSFFFAGDASFQGAALRMNPLTRGLSQSLSSAVSSSRGLGLLGLLGTAEVGLPGGVSGCLRLRGLMSIKGASLLLSMGSTVGGLMLPLLLCLIELSCGDDRTEPLRA